MARMIAPLKEGQSIMIKRTMLFFLLMAGINGWAQNIMEDPPLTHTFFGAPLAGGTGQRHGLDVSAAAAFPRQSFFAAADRAGFCSFSGVTNVHVADGKLVMTLAKDTAVLGWGNYNGLNPDFKITSYPEMFTVALAVNQSGTSLWTCVYTNDALNRQQGNIKKMPAAQGALDLRFENILVRGERRWYRDGKVRTGNGLEFTINGHAGETIEIERVEIINSLYKVYVRHEFVLPEEKIWRAVADVCAGGKLYWSCRARLLVNGHVLEIPPVVEGSHGYYLMRLNGHAFDIAPWLKPGTNVIGVYDEQLIAIPPIALQSRIVMKSGEVIDLASGPGWRYGFAAEDGWSKPGFDAANWQTVTQTTAWSRAQIDSSTWLPAHQGRLLLANQDSRELVFNDTTNAVLEALIPAGMQALAPQVAYKIGRCRDGAVEEVKGGTITEARLDGDNLVYRMDLGKLPGGVYVAALALLDKGGAIIETRPREPFVVITASQGKMITGQSYTEGLDLELEATIDCANPNDPHPTFESCPADGVIKTPTIVNKAGLRYREVASWRRGAGFTYRIEFKHPGSFYLMEVEYPDDAKRIIEVIINGKQTGVWNNCQSASGVETGGRHLPTGRMEKLQWLHVADKGVHSIDIVNHHNNEKGAASTIKIYRVKGRLPELAVGHERAFGHYTERTSYSSGIANVFGVGRIGVFDNPGYRETIKLSESRMALRIMELEWLCNTYDRYIQWMKFSGRNLHVLGCYQYNSRNDPLLPVPGYRTARVSQCPRRILAQFMDANNIAFYSEVEWGAPPDPFAATPEMQMIARDGKEGILNWMHPEVKASYEKLISDIADTFADLQAYRGVHAVLNMQTTTWTIPGFAGSKYQSPPRLDALDALLTSYDDLTFDLFEKEAGLKTGIAIKDPDRFQARAKLIEANPALREKFLVWRGRKLTELYAGVAARIKKKRSDLELALVPAACMYSWENMTPQLFEAMERKDKSLGMDAYLKMFGINLQDLNAVPGVFVGRWAVAWIRSRQNKYNTTQDPYIWLGQTDPKHTDFFNRYSPTRRYAMLYLDWNESFLNGPSGTRKHMGGCILADDSDWLMTLQLVRCQSQFGGLNAREPITQAMIVSDPDMLVHGFSDLALPSGHEQALRSIVRVISYLPKELFEPVLNTRLDTNLAIRQLKKGKDTWFYVANPCQWPVKGRLELKNSGTLYSMPDDKHIGIGIMQLPIELEPFGLLAFRSDSAECQITGYRTEPLAQEWLERITGVIQSIRAFVQANAVKYMLTTEEQTALAAQLERIDALLVKGEYAAAWSALTLPEVWKYYIYEPSVEERYFGEDLARRKKEKLTSDLILNPARLPEKYLSAKRLEESPRVLPTLRATSPIKIDGVFAEAAWNGAEFSSGFWVWEDQTNSLAETGVCARYDEQALYLAFVCADPDTSELKADARGEKDLWTIGDDALGFLLYPKAQGIYYQFGFNTKKARFDQQCIVGGAKLYEEYKPEWQFASQAHQKYWIAEARIPWKAIGLEAPPAELGFNALRGIRYRAVEGGLWNPTPSAHDLNYFGVLRFND